MNERIAFIGGGNMARAIIGGLIKHGFPPDHFEGAEPFEEAPPTLPDKLHLRPPNTPRGGGVPAAKKGSVAWREPKPHLPGANRASSRWPTRP